MPDISSIFVKVQKYDSWPHIPRQDGFTLTLLHASRNYTCLLQTVLRLSENSNISFAGLTWREDVQAGENDVLIYVPNDMLVGDLKNRLRNFVNLVFIEGEFYAEAQTTVGSMLEIIGNQEREFGIEQLRFIRPNEDVFWRDRPSRTGGTIRLPIHMNDHQVVPFLRAHPLPRGFAFGDLPSVNTVDSSKPTIQEYACTPENQIAINNAVMRLGRLDESFSRQCIISLEEINWQTIGIVAIYSASRGFDFFVATYGEHDIAEKIQNERHPLTREPILAIQKFANLQEFADLLPRLSTKPKMCVQ